MTEKNVTMMDIVMIAHIIREKVNQVIKLPITGKPLKPCPFCGSEKVSMYDESVRDYFFSEDRYLIECDRCSANIERYSETGVKRAWNRREGDRNDG